VKLYLIVRRDLAPSARAVQLCHALRAFVEEHPAEDQVWFQQSNTLVLLEVDDEDCLERLMEKARSTGVSCALFREPDIGDQVTAIAIAPAGKRLVRGLPLATLGVGV